MGTENEITLDTAVVVIKTKDGDYHQVALNKDEIVWVISLIVKLHDGEIKVTENKLQNISF